MPARWLVLARSLVLAGSLALAASLVLAGCRATPAVVTGAATGASPTLPDATVPGTAGGLLAGLAVKGRSALAGYRRELFGQTWADVDRNGCDTRNDILRRDLTAQRIRAGTAGCVVLAGRLADPYTGSGVAFVRGGADDVEIDHVVALADAWVTGAAGWTPQRRVAFANDPVNLLAVSATANRSKGESDAATWLPPNRAFGCSYAARQVTVKAKYGLWVTPAELATLLDVLGQCPGTSAIPFGTQPTESSVGAADSGGTTGTGPAAPPTSVGPSAPGTGTPPPGPTPIGAPSTDTPPPGVPPTVPVVRPGALCSPPGALGRTEAGTAMRCTVTTTDPRYRWRRA